MRPWVVLVWKDHRGWRPDKRFWRRRTAHQWADILYEDFKYNCWVVHKKAMKEVIHQ